jgi:hypothetical protein
MNGRLEFMEPKMKRDVINPKLASLVYDAIIGCGDDDPDRFALLKRAESVLGRPLTANEAAYLERIFLQTMKVAETVVSITVTNKQKR